MQLPGVARNPHASSSGGSESAPPQPFETTAHVRGSTKANAKAKERRMSSVYVLSRVPDQIPNVDGLLGVDAARVSAFAGARGLSNSAATDPCRGQERRK